LILHGVFFQQKQANRSKVILGPKLHANPVRLFQHNPYNL
jgi:hypothetical protein